MVYRIIFLTLLCCKLFSAEHVYLKTPTITKEAMIGTSVGVRPYRKTGIRLEAEWVEDKLIIHNYGYGGSGLTLAFGGSQKVVELLNRLRPPSKEVAILGGGVVGLAAAYDLMEKGYQVHLYADKWSPHLTSNVAAGSWTPLLLPVTLSKKKKRFHKELLEIAADRFHKSLEEDPEFEGIKQMCYYITSNQAQGMIQALDPGEEVVVHFDNGLVKRAMRVNKLGIVGNIFMEDLFSKVKTKGACLVEKHFSHRDEILHLKEPTIINCLSLGARELFQDNDFTPIRGQLIHFAQQEIDFVLAQRTSEPGYFFFVYPWNDRLILGGVYEEGKEELITDPEVIEKLLTNGEKYFSGNL